MVESRMLNVTRYDMLILTLWDSAKNIFHNKRVVNVKELSKITKRDENKIVKIIKIRRFKKENSKLNRRVIV